MVTPNLAQHIGPVTPRERMSLLDVLRGFCLFGVLIVNWDNTRGILRPIVWLLGDGSFYPALSLLFGAGFALQLRRAQSSGQRFVVRYLWRSMLLLIIGLLHFVFLYTQDILRIYAICSLALLLTARWPSRLVLAASVGFLLLAMAPPWSVPSPGEFWVLADPEQRQASEMERLIVDRPPVICEALPGLTLEYRREVCGAMASARQLLTNDVFALPFWRRWADIVGMFLLGAYVGRRRYFDAVRDRRVLVVLSIVGLAAGFAGNAIEATGLPPGPAGWNVATVAGGVGLALFYLSAVTLLWNRSERGRRLLQPLAPVGQMALTNYLLQSALIGGLLLRLGPGAQIVDLWNIGLLTLFFVIQAAASAWWLRRFTYGPVEWLWRSLVWLRVEPMRQPSTARAPLAETP